MHGFSLIDGIDIAVGDKFTEMVNILNIMASQNGSDTVSEVVVPDQNEVEKLKTFVSLEKKLHPKGIKGARRCISIEDVGLNVNINLS